MALTPFAPLGWALMAHGFDQSLAGAYLLFTGESRSTLTSQLLQKGGLTSHHAELIDGGIAIFGMVGGVAGIRIGQTSLSLRSSWNASRMIVQPKQVRTTIGNPFRGKCAAEIDKMFKTKGFESRGPNPIEGKGGVYKCENWTVISYR